MEARALDVENFFSSAREQMDSVITRLHSEDTLTMTHSDVEAFVSAEGKEILRRLLQAHFDLRALARPAGAIVGADRVERTHRRIRSIPLKTIVGEVAVTREAYSARDAGSLHPLDAALNMPPRLYSFGVHKRVAVEASKGSFEEVVAAIEETTGTTVPKRQAEELVREAATDFDAFYETRRDAGAVPALETSSILVITSDAKGVAMRKEDLRPATQKAAEGARPKLEKRLSKGEKRNKKRMAMVAAVYTVAPFIRRAEDIVGEFQPVQGTAIRRPRPERKRVWASVEKSPEAVLNEAFQEALSRDPEKKKRWVALVDGNEVQLSDMLVLAERHHVEVTAILDIIHVLEYLWKAAWAFHVEGDESVEAEKWVTERLLEILRGKSSDVAAGVRRSATKRGLSAKQREPADTCADYLLKYRDFLRYDQYLAAGLPIATGVAEGACRHLIQDRMGRTGARWGLEGAEAVLRLRALRSSGDFQEYWLFHEDCELERNHRSNYPHGKLPEMLMPPALSKSLSGRAPRSSEASS